MTTKDEEGMKGMKGRCVKSRMRPVRLALSPPLPFAFLLALAALPVAGVAAPPAYPNKPIRFIVPYPVGGSIDISGRIVAQQLGENVGQQVVVDNRTGAGGTIGTEAGARAVPDGYTIVMGGTGTLAISPGMGRKLGYDPVKDFAPVTLLATTPYVLVAHPSVPAASVKELIALARSQPGKLNYASGGSGSAPHLVGEMFKTAGRAQHRARAVQGQHAGGERPRRRARCRCSLPGSRPSCRRSAPAG